MDHRDVFAIAMLLVLVMDPFGNMFVVHGLLGGVGGRRRLAIVLREGIIAALLLIGLTFSGHSVIDYLGLEQHSIRLAGGIVLFLIAIGMVFPNRRMSQEEPADSPLIVPIAIPLIAGPSAISMVILFSESEPLMSVVQAIGVAVSFTVAVLAATPWLVRLLTHRGAIAVERLMGIVLIVMSVQMVLDGVDAFLDSRVT